MSCFLYSQNIIISDELFQSAQIDAEEVEVDTVGDEKLLYAGIGIAQGFFSPGDLTEYIDAVAEDYMSLGYPEMYLNYTGKVLVAARFHRNIEIAFFCEFGIAVKRYAFWFFKEGTYYFFSKQTPGISSKFHFQLESRGNSLFIAPAVTHNFFWFDDRQVNGTQFRANGWGGRLQAGLCFHMKNVILQPFIACDYAKAIDMESVIITEELEVFSEMELDYSGFQIGIELLF